VIPSIVLAVVLLLSIIGISFLKTHLEKILLQQIDLHTQGNLKVDFQDVSLNALTQSAVVEGIEVSQNDSSGQFWSASIEEIEVQDLSVITLLTGGGVKLDSVVIHDVKIEIHSLPDSLGKGPHPEMEKKNKEKLPLHIGGIRMNAAELAYDPEGPIEALATVDFILRGLKIEEGSPLDFEYHFRQSSFHCALQKIVTPDSLYTISVDEIGKEFGDEITIKGLSLEPNLSLAEFSKFYGWNKGMLEIKVDEIQSGVDLSSFPDSIAIPWSQVNNPNLLVKKDNRWPFPDRVTPLPQEILTGLPFKVNIDSSTVSNGNIELSLIMEDGEEAVLKVDEVNALSKIQNSNLSLPAIEVRAEQKVMGVAHTEVSTTYTYGESCPFEFDLSMVNTDLSFMSGFFQKAIGIRISAGQLKHLDIDMQGNKYTTRGNVIFKYEDLSIDAVNKDTGKKKVVLNALADVLGSLVFWKSNPAHDQLREGQFEIERDVRKAFMAQWFDGIQAGIINVVAKVDPIKSREKKENKKKEK